MQTLLGGAVLTPPPSRKKVTLELCEGLGTKRGFFFYETLFLLFMTLSIIPFLNIYTSSYNTEIYACYCMSKQICPFTLKIGHYSWTNSKCLDFYRNVHYEYTESHTTCPTSLVNFYTERSQILYKNEKDFLDI